MSNTFTNISRGYFIFLMIFLGMLSAFGPFVTDMYLPTLPSLATVFHSTTSMVQMGLTTSMIGLAIGQLIFGPLSDKYGRKPILYWSLILFSASTAISIFSPSIEFFNIMRLFQGIGGAGGLVMSRSIATDSYSGRELAKALAIIGAVNGIAPVSAPVIGGIVSTFTGWQGIFVILLLIGIILIAMCTKYRETLPTEQRNHANIKTVYATFGKVLKIKVYVMYLIAFGCANGMLFSYISSAPFVLQTHFGFSEFAFSLFFALNSVSIGLGSTLALKFKKMESAAHFGAIGALIFAILQFAGYLMFDNVYIYGVTMFMMLCNAGFVFTSCTTLAMDAGREYTGAASAIFGAVAFSAGGVVSPIVGMGNMMHTLGITLIVSAALCFIMITYARHVIAKYRNCDI